MFSYYGAKTKIIDRYPKPMYDTIIEPFAGSARYALRYWDRNVELYDVSEYVIEVWKYLINASAKDILGLPILERYENIDSYGLSDGEKYFIGFNLCPAKSKPRRIGHGKIRWTENERLRIAQNIYKVRHWKVVLGSFESIENKTATYLVDPPYIEVQKVTTEQYLYSQLDYDKLQSFIQSRNGQVIVCEGKGADYCDFDFLMLNKTLANKENWEYIYHANNGVKIPYSYHDHLLNG